MPRLFGLLALAVALFGWTPSASAAFLTYTIGLSGPAEAPPNASPGTGFGVVDIDTDLNTMRVRVTFQGLIGTVTASHIHATTPTPFTGTAGVATPVPTFPGFPSGVTAGSYDQTFDMTLASSYNPAFVTANGGVPAARTALFNAIGQSRAYLNVHTTAFPGGEIRGFTVPAPAPSGLVLAAVGGAGLFAGLRRRVRTAV